MSLSLIEQALLLSAFFRGNTLEQTRWTSCSDQVITLSLFYTGDITASDCQSRFVNLGYVGALYDDNGELRPEIANRYASLITLLRSQPELIKGAGDFDMPAYPTYTSCRLTDKALRLIDDLIVLFPRKPVFPEWPDRRTHPDTRLL